MQGNFFRRGWLWEDVRARPGAWGRQHGMAYHTVPVTGYHTVSLAGAGVGLALRLAKQEENTDREVRVLWCWHAMLGLPPLDGTHLLFFFVSAVDQDILLWLLLQQRVRLTCIDVRHLLAHETVKHGTG